ncbi:MAG: hypothetical protein KAR42_04240 [candidate division Zixibacteria bacterium]|nr:hypothetical protein [candidate division Zixibacteria bacterium]
MHTIFRILIFSIMLGGICTVSWAQDFIPIETLPGEIPRYYISPQESNEVATKFDNDFGWDCWPLNLAGDPALAHRVPDIRPGNECSRLFMRYTIEPDPWNMNVLLKSATLLLYPPYFRGEPDMVIQVWTGTEDVPTTMLSSDTVAFEDLPTEYSEITIDLLAHEIELNDIEAFLVVTTVDTVNSGVAVIGDYDEHDEVRLEYYWGGEWRRWPSSVSFYAQMYFDICTAALDDDSDMVGNIDDNCVDTYNPDQLDSDGDGIGDVCDYVCGDANYDISANVADVVYIINNIFRGGPNPYLAEAVEVNADEVYNIGDAVTIVNYIFKGGQVRCQPVVLYQYPQYQKIPQNPQCKTLGKDGDNLSVLDCVSCIYDGASLLHVIHTNTTFNCCVLQIEASVELSGMDIVVTESETPDGGWCACLCFYDFDYYIQNIPPGVYTLTVNERYADGMEELSIELDLTGGATSGDVCIERTE